VGTWGKYGERPAEREAPTPRWPRAVAEVSPALAEVAGLAASASATWNLSTASSKEKRALNSSPGMSRSRYAVSKKERGLNTFCMGAPNKTWLAPMSLSGSLQQEPVLSVAADLLRFAAQYRTVCRPAADC